jgi:FSR family fosmidomycin resistance protein-like MFS transporter
MSDMDHSHPDTRKTIRYLMAYGFAHFLVDASCYFLLLGSNDSGNELMLCIILYNMLAFGLQLPFGWISDYLGKPVLLAFFGCMAICPAFFILRQALAATILAGIGNALFHVGGGSVALNLRPGKAVMPGIFVAPGGLGLFAGSMMVQFQLYPAYLMAVILFITGAILLLLKQPEIRYVKNKINAQSFVFVCLILLFVTIGIRSAVGLSVSYPWKTEMSLFTIFIVAIALGKGAGGYLSDRFGWVKVTVSGLAVSAILLYFGAQVPIAGISGIFLFNFSMPVTLTAISNLLPGRPGFSFGLTTMALLAGSLPLLFKFNHFIAGDMRMVLLVLVSAATLLAGLLLYHRLFYSRA